ncbi:MAG TPA: uracil-DNA glycosylase family protein, partial [Acidimicrobiales bacterium]|nr:uracil-DNA glycosylase family protein [Acidimicrobiales bacterium]
ATIETYEREAQTYRDRRPLAHAARARDFAARCLPGLPAVDLGCGPGGYLPYLPAPAVAFDATWAMLRLARSAAPSAALLRGDLEALPFGDGSLGGAWARHSYLHLARDLVPMACARLHRALALHAPLMISVSRGEGEGPWPGDDIPGRFFCCWQPEQLRDVLTGAGFEVSSVEVEGDSLYVRATRSRTLADTVGRGMRLLLCGLNPSLVAADAGFAFAGATNRFWPAALEAGAVSRVRAPFDALVRDGVGMTDLVKRATARSSGIEASEYRNGAERLRRLVSWLGPRAVCFVGLEGWRAAIDHSARPGWQPEGFAGSPAYVMPSTSGANAATSRAELVAHLREVLRVAGG